MSIVIRRSGALGDVVLTTPIIRQLRLDHPDAKIHVQTGQHWVYADNPRVTQAPPASVSRFIDLDTAYEKRPRMHVVDAYAEAAGVVVQDKQQELWMWRSAKRRRLVDRLVPEGAVLIHPAKSWPNRTLPAHVWGEVAVLLAERGRVPVIVGTSNDEILPLTVGRRPIIDTRGQLTPMEVAYACTRAACFVGSDSGLLHVAGATECPIVGIFTSARAEYRLPYRNGELGWRCTAVTPDLDCYGCLADEPAPVTTCGCRRGDLACVARITAAEVVMAAVRLIAGSTGV